MRIAPRFFLLFASMAITCCRQAEPLGTDCSVSTDCGLRQLCVDGVCVDDPTPLPVGEGEGEGDPGEGEGEGEPPAEGEGEGDTAPPGWVCTPSFFGTDDGCDCGCGLIDPDCATTGGGCAAAECNVPGCAFCYDATGDNIGCDAGGEGEGEGEGEGDLAVCAPVCGSLQGCTATNVCTNDVGTSLCDTFGATTIDFFADQNLNVNDAGGDRYVFDGKDRFYVNRLTNMRQGMRVEVALIAAFDTVAYVLDDSAAQCTQLARIDQSFDDERFIINNGGGLTPPFSGARATPVDLVVTSFDAINGGVDNGPFTLQTRGVLCTDGNAANDITDTQTTYDQCFRALFERATTLTCAQSNPCARNAAGETTGKFCTLQTNVHTAGAAITLGNDVPGGACCLASAGCPGPTCPANCQ